MRVTIIPADSMVYVDGKAIRVDCSSMPSEIHTVQWDGAKGEIELNTINGSRKYNEQIEDIGAFQHLVDAWHVALSKMPPRPAATAPKSQ